MLEIIMQKDNSKKLRKYLNFDEQLQFQLKNIKPQLKHTQPLKSHKKRQMANIIDDAVNQLQDDDSLAFTNLQQQLNLPPQPPKKNKINHRQIQEIDELEINEESSILQRDRNVGMKRSYQNRQKDEFGNHIWNLVSQNQIVVFLKDNFALFRQEDSISMQEFILKALQYYTNLEPTQQEIYKIKDHMKSDLTTTSADILSLNALQILVKKMSIQTYVVQSYIQAKIKAGLSEMNKKSKKVMEGVTERMDQIVYRQQELEHRFNELFKKQSALNAKQKSLGMKQKQMLQREQQCKKSVEDKSNKLYEININQFENHVKQTEKRLIQLEKNVKNKINILESRAKNMKLLINEQNEIKSKKVCNQSQARIRLRKVEKELDLTQKRHKGQIQQLKNEEKEIIAKITQMEQKISKQSNKNKKQKDIIQQLEINCLVLKQKNTKLQEENQIFELSLKEMKNKIPEQNVLKGIKSKQGTSRSTKNKHKKQHNQLPNIIFLYQHILQCNAPSNTQRNTFKKGGVEILPIMKQMMPFIISLLCSQEQNQTDSKKPHQLVLYINQLAIKQRIKDEKQCQRLWSLELSQLLQLPFSTVTNLSLFLFLLPILDWHHPTATTFFKNTISQIITRIQQTTLSTKVSQIFWKQEQFITSGQFIQYLTTQFISIFPLDNKNVNERTQFELILNLASSVVDLLISLSSSEQDRKKLTQKYMCDIIISAFQFLCNTIITIHDAQTNTGRKRKQIIFAHLELIQQLCQKLSILIQRIIHNSSVTLLSSLELSPLAKIHKHLKELNQINGNRHFMILANIANVLSQLEQP